MDVEADGPWVRVNLMSAPENPAQQHDPPLSLPPVPNVANCSGVRGASTSTPVPSTTDFRPADVLAQRGAAPLPATGARVAVSFAVAAALAAFAVRRLTRA
jgi:hypothetical protein